MFHETPEDLAKISPLIPPNLLESSEIKDQGILEEYQRINADLQEILRDEIASEITSMTWIEKTKQMAKTMFIQPILDLMKRRSEIYVNYILPSIAQFKLKLKKGVTADFVKSNVEYGAETLFAREASNSVSRGSASFMSVLQESVRCFFIFCSYSKIGF